MVIQMFWRDHNPTHFHASYAGKEVLIDIRTLGILEGALFRRALLLVLEWAHAHRDERLEDWDLCQRKQRPRPIAPLP